MIFIIDDKMNHGKTIYPCFFSKNKNVDMFIKLYFYAKGLIVYTLEDECYTHFSLDLFPGDRINIVGLFIKLFQTFTI